MGNPLLVNIDLQIAASGELEVNLDLVNTLSRDLSDWNLQFDLPKAIKAGQQTTLHERVGSHICLSPHNNPPLLAGHSHRMQIVGQPSIIQRLSDLPNGLYVQAGDDILEASLGQHNLVQMKALLKDCSALLNPDSAVDGAIHFTPLPAPVNPAAAASEYSGLIPRPILSQPLTGEFHSYETLAYSAVPEAQDALDWLSQALPNQATLVPQVGDNARLHFVMEPVLAAEAYHLHITVDAVTISAATAAGFFYGAVSLAQMTGPAQDLPLSLPCLHIEDQPRFGYRGLMLDCSRHIHSKATILGLLDHMARYKFNRFHWHLTDDEGWRVEIDAYPELTAQGAWRGPEEILQPQFGSGATRYGGFYSHADIREIVDYARQRQIIVIPEIDIPGHARAAIKALPELLIEPEDQSEYCSVQFYTDNVLNPALPGTYQFLHTVLDELCDLFPGPYIHMGSDEVPSGVWQASPACQAFAKQHNYQDVADLQGHLLCDLQAYLQGKGKQLVGWEEATQGNKLERSALICTWTEPASANAILEAGYSVIACPAPYAYLDLAWDNNIDEPGFQWAGTANLETCYAFEPNHCALTEQGTEQIVGVQALLWSELLTSPERLEYMLFPRVLAIAETAWSPLGDKDWDNFKQRVSTELKALKQRGVGHRDLSKDS